MKHTTSRAALILALVWLANTACTGVDTAETTPTFEIPEGATPEATFEVVLVDPGDATEDELDVLFAVVAASILGNEVDMSEIFTAQAEFFSGRGRYTGREDIGTFLNRSRQVGWWGETRDFRRFGERLVFNWVFNERNTGVVTAQGVEAVFEDGLLSLFDVSSTTVPYCLGATESGCKNYETGEVIPISP